MSFRQAQSVAMRNGEMGIVTAPFQAEPPNAISLQRMRCVMPEGASVEVRTAQQLVTVRSNGVEYGVSRNSHIPIGHVQLRAVGRGSFMLSDVMHDVLPIFRANAERPAKPWHYVWFAGSRELHPIYSDFVGMVQDMALCGEGLPAALGIDFCRAYEGRVPWQLRGTYQWIENLSQAGTAPEYGELAQHMLGLTLAIAMDRDPQSLQELFQAQVLEVAENAIQLFDVQTVAHALVVGALDATARLDGKDSERAMEFRRRLQSVMDSSLTFATRAEGFEKLAYDMHAVPTLSILGAAMLLMAGREYLEVARSIRYHGLKSRRLNAARSVFETARDRMNALKGKSDILGSVFAMYAKRQLGIGG